MQKFLTAGVIFTTIALIYWSINNVNINKPKIVKKGVELGALSSPFTKDELKALYSTQVLTDPAARLMVDLAVQTGSRVGEITGFTAGNVVDPAIANKSVYNVNIAGKYDKRRVIMVSKNLMKSLWDYRNGSDHQHRLLKWKLTTGSCKDAPLFFNRSGEHMSPQSVSNVIAKAIKELAEHHGIVLKGSFNDLRRTFAINHAGFLSSENLPIDSIKLWSAHLLAHSHSSTTQQYIKSSDSLTFDKQIDSRIFEEKAQREGLSGKN
ncbi:MAG: site-specific recombinase XerD [Oleiphilaceae bacterium]